MHRGFVVFWKFRWLMRENINLLLGCFFTVLFTIDCYDKLLGFIMASFVTGFELCCIFF